MKKVSEKNLTAVGYVRVSTNKQDEENQVRAIEKYCRGHNIRLMKVFKDRGVSGLKKFSDRQGASELLQYINENSVDAVIVTSIDRIARDSLDLKNMIEYFKNNNIRIITLSDSEGWINYLFDDSVDDVYKLVANILLETLSFFAQFELKKRRERQELAWASGKQKGRPVKITDDELLEYLKKYRSKGLSYKAIWAILNSDLERKRRETISYQAFMMRVRKLREEGKIREVISS
ncbi:recombinase family protein [Thermococcus onnurineus]|nr:recombinase family protein [Thermococcus onnurineus]